jgi:Cu(I)/Ag(I) efflux system membrane protein CusA/SilA
MKFPQGSYVTWSGQFGYMARALEKLKLVVTFALAGVASRRPWSVE